jgi:hypothetical protein
MNRPRYKNAEFQSLQLTDPTDRSVPLHGMLLASISFHGGLLARHLEMETSAEMIEFLVGAVGANSSEYDRQIFERALRELVRIAQAEKIAAIEQDFITAERAASQNYRPHS